MENKIDKGEVFFERQLKHAIKILKEVATGFVLISLVLYVVWDLVNLFVLILLLILNLMFLFLVIKWFRELLFSLRMRKIYNGIKIETIERELEKIDSKKD